MKFSKMISNDVDSSPLVETWNVMTWDTESSLALFFFSRVIQELYSMQVKRALFICPGRSTHCHSCPVHCLIFPLFFENSDITNSISTGDNEISFHLSTLYGYSTQSWVRLSSVSFHSFFSFLRTRISFNLIFISIILQTRRRFALGRAWKLVSCLHSLGYSFIRLNL